MTQTLQYHAEIERFFFQYGDTTRLYPKSALWNLGIPNRAIETAMWEPMRRINLEEYVS